MTRRYAISLLFTVLVAFAPSGTRYIWRTGSIGGQPVEPGTVSLFGMQVVAAVFAALVFLTYGKKLFLKTIREPHALAACFIAGIALLSAFDAADFLSGFVSAFSVILGVAVFLAVLLYRPDPHEALTSFIGGAIFQTAFGGWQFFTQSAFANKWLGMAMHSPEQLGAFVVETATGRWLRAYGQLAHPNIFGLYVGLGLLTCIGLAAFRGHGKHLHLYGFMPVIAAGLIFSFSRSAILAVAVGFLWMTMSAFATDAAPAFRRILVPSFIIIAVTSAVLGFLYAEPLLVRATGQGRLEGRSFTERELLFSDATALFVRHPIAGVGVGQMPTAAAREVDPGRDWWTYQYVHNVPTLVAVETGIGGLIAWLVFVGYTLKIVWQRLSLKASASSGVTVYASAFIAILAASMFDHFLWSSWFGQLLFWTVAGLLHAAYGQLKKA
jgi:O-antigen ligase